MKKKDFLKTPVRHIDITSFDATPIIEGMKEMSFTARDLANAADIYDRMLDEKKCGVILTLAGSTSAGGCMQIYVEMVKNNMVDAIVATGAAIVDMDFFEALGFKHYQGTPFVDDKVLRKLYIDRIYDTFIDENDLQACDKTIQAIADGLAPPLFLTGVHPGDGSLPDPAQRQEGFPRPGSLRARCPDLLPRLLGQQCRFWPRPPPGEAPQDSPLHRLGEGFPGTDGDQDQSGDIGPFDDRQRRPEELRPGHGRLRRDPGKRGPDAQVRHPDHRGRRPRRGLLQLYPEGGQLLGEGGQQLRADGLRGSHVGPPASGELCLAQGELEEAKALAVYETLQGLKNQANQAPYKQKKGTASFRFRSACPLFHIPGGDEGARTPSLRIANAALSQLSYIPMDIKKLRQRTPLRISGRAYMIRRETVKK
jgi:hypothetical protein